MKSELQNVKMGMTWTSYIAAAYGVLCASELWVGEVWQLMGMTGMAFRFTMHETACPSSVAMYDWNMHHFQMMDRIGVYTDSISIMNQPGMNTYDNLKADAITHIKQSLDMGRGVVTWAPSPILEFGIITGYDDAERIFTVIDCTGNPNLDPLLYDNLGKCEVPFLYIQRFQDKCEVDKEKIFRESLIFGVRHWQEKHIDSRYANGDAAYANLISCLEKGSVNEFGLTYNLNVYADSKQCLALYLADLVKQTQYLQGLEKVVPLYTQIAACFREAVVIAPFTQPGVAMVNKQRLPELIDLLKQSRQLEAKAIAEIKNQLELDL